RGRIREQRVPERLAGLAVGEADHGVDLPYVAVGVAACPGQLHLRDEVLLDLRDDPVLARLLERQLQSNTITGGRGVARGRQRDRLSRVGLAGREGRYVAVFVLGQPQRERSALQDLLSVLCDLLDDLLVSQGRQRAAWRMGGEPV